MKKKTFDPGRLPAIIMWAQEGLRDVDICKKLGCGKTVFYQWKNDYPEFAEALKSAKDEADAKVVSALYQKAMGGDTTAMIFWLKNRKPEQWRDKREHLLGGNTEDNAVVVKVVRDARNTNELGV